MAQQQQQQTMKYKFLGKSGLKVSELCLGSMTFGASAWNMPSEVDESKCFEMLDRFVAAGGNFIDTADAYGLGESERIIGKWLQTQDRDSLVIGTKCRFFMKNSPNGGGLSRKHIISAVESSLERLQTHYIDLYQVHAFDAGTPLKETLMTLHELVRCGKVRYIGASNFHGWGLQKAIDLSEAMGIEVFSSLQTQYSLLCREPEWELMPVCRNEGLGVLPWSPLKGGWLTGKYDRSSSPPSEGRVAWAQGVGWEETNWSKFANEHTWNIVDRLKEISNETGRSIAQISLRWCLQRPGITSPVIGARTLAQLEDNLACLDFELSPEHMMSLSEVSAIPWPYPYNVIKRGNERDGRRRYKGVWI